MSAGIKRMLAERERVEAAKARAPDFEANKPLLDLIDRAATFIDEGCPKNKWPPSAKLRVAYFIMATGQSGETKAVRFVQKRLNIARARYLAGLHPNPFLGPVEAGGQG